MAVKMKIHQSLGETEAAVRVHMARKSTCATAFDRKVNRKTHTVVLSHGRSADSNFWIDFYLSPFS